MASSLWKKTIRLLDTITAFLYHKLIYSAIPQILIIMNKTFSVKLILIFNKEWNNYS